MYALLAKKAIRLRTRASIYLRDYLREHGNLHGIEEQVNHPALFKLLDTGLANPSPSERVQILLDEILAPLMEESVEKFHWVLHKMWNTGPGDTANEKFANAVAMAKTRREQCEKDLEAQQMIVQEAEEAGQYVNKQKLYEAQHQLAKAKIYLEAIKVQNLYIRPYGIKKNEKRNREVCSIVSRSGLSLEGFHTLMSNGAAWGEYDASLHITKQMVDRMRKTSSPFEYYYDSYLRKVELGQL